ncbi:MAG: hypothetical protein RR728_11640, partial [Oscillospiraceae bacterium]
MVDTILHRSWKVLRKNLIALIFVCYFLNIFNNFFTAIDNIVPFATLVFLSPVKLGVRYCYVRVYDGHSLVFRECYTFFKDIHRFLMAIVFSCPTYFLYLSLDIVSIFFPSKVLFLFVRYFLIIVVSIYTETLLYVHCFNIDLPLYESLVLARNIVNNNFKKVLIFQICFILGGAIVANILLSLPEIFASSPPLLLLLTATSLCASLFVPQYCAICFAGFYESIIPKEFGGGKFPDNFYDSQEQDSPSPHNAKRQNRIATLGDTKNKYSISAIYDSQKEDNADSVSDLGDSQKEDSATDLGDSQKEDSVADLGDSQKEDSVA